MLLDAFVTALLVLGAWAMVFGALVLPLSAKRDGDPAWIVGLLCFVSLDMLAMTVLAGFGVVSIWS